MTGGLELDVLAEPLVELVPERPRPARERQLGEVAALLAHAAEIDAARAGAAQALLEQRDRQPGLAQRDGRGAAGDAAADDRDVDAQALAHGALATIGIGLTGGWPRRRPTRSRSLPQARARSSAAASPQTRPWQRPMPIRVSALTRLISRAPWSRAACAQRRRP